MLPIVSTRIKKASNLPTHYLTLHLCYVIQERTDNVDKRKQDIEKANKKHAELKKRRDNTTNRRK